MTNTIINEETELKAIITDKFIQASNNILEGVIMANDTNGLSIDEKMAISNKAFIAECNRVYGIYFCKRWPPLTEHQCRQSKMNVCLHIAARLNVSVFLVCNRRSANLIHNIHSSCGGGIGLPHRLYSF